MNQNQPRVCEANSNAPERARQLEQMNQNEPRVCAANSNAPERARRFDDHVCTFAPPSVWVRLIVRNGGVPRRFWPKLARILALSIAAAPLRLAETVASSRLLPRATLREPPLFVLGLARTGTTHPA